MTKKKKKKKKTKQIVVKLNAKKISKYGFWPLVIVLLLFSLFLGLYVIRGISELNENEISLITGEKIERDEDEEIKDNGDVFAEDSSSEEVNKNDVKDKNLPNQEESSISPPYADILEGGGVNTERDQKEIENIIIERTQAEQRDYNDAWVANNYSDGDIVSNSYTVKSGDTLWEIAEGYYGDGRNWRTILEKNKSQIGYLSNGQQALIFPGQILSL